MSLPLIISTTLSFLNVFSSSLDKYFLKWINAPTLEEKSLMDEKRKLKSEQSQINMIDNFAKYSKLQRKINAVNEKLSNINSEKSGFLRKLAIRYGIQLVLGVIFFLLTIYYRRTPVFSVDSSIDLVPFRQIITYPNPGNNVSFHFWTMCCTVVAKYVQKQLK